MITMAAADVSNVSFKMISNLIDGIVLFVIMTQSDPYDRSLVDWSKKQQTSEFPGSLPKQSG